MHTFSSSIFVEGFLDYGLEVTSGMNRHWDRKTQFFSYGPCADDAYSRYSIENEMKEKNLSFDLRIQKLDGYF